MSDDASAALADALRALGDTLRFHRDLGVEHVPLEGDYLLGPADALASQEHALQGCQRCKLSSGRTTIVFGSGNPRAEFMCIGEGPGADEDAQGKPFVGRAGQLLTKMLESIHFSRDEVYITNTVKCFISPRVPIYTSDGYKPIKDIKIGDLVLTHRGRFRQVTHIRPREMLLKGSEVIRLAVQPDDGSRKPVHMTVTPEHPFLIDGAWKPARDIGQGDSVSTLGDQCEVCGRTCGYTCHNRRIFHSAEARAKVSRSKLLVEVRGPGFGPSNEQRALFKEQLAKDAGYLLLRRILKNHAHEYVFVDAKVISVDKRRTGRDFPLYNIGVEEDESYIAAGVVSHNCRPPGNRNPESDELGACAEFLAAQLGIIQPKVVLSLGSVATQALLNTKEPIGKLRGRLHAFGNAVLVPTFHPAYLLRNPGPQYRRMAYEDLKLARREYDARRTR